MPVTDAELDEIRLRDERRERRCRLVRSIAGGTALALYGGLAWLVCIPVGFFIGIEISGWEDPGPGIIQGAEKNPLTSSFLHIVGSILVLWLVAYSLFFALLARQRR